jgi:pyrroloquinoline quinone biosynthesis protein B
MGHYTGLVHLGREAMGAEAVPVYGMPRMVSLLQDSEPWALLGRLGHIDVRPVVGGKPVALSEQVTVTPRVVPHRDELTETVGWVVQGPSRSVLWLPDIDKWERWSVPLEDVLAEVDVAYLDATFFADGEIARDMAEVPHPFVVETLGRLAHHPELRAKVRFVHLNHTNPLLQPGHEAHEAVQATGARVAVEGERLGL